MEEKEKKIIGKRVQAVRVALGLSQKEIAERLSITPPGYYYVEAGRNALTGTLLSLMEAKLRVRPDYLLKGIEPMFYPKEKEHPRPVYMLYIVYLIQEYIKSKTMRLRDFSNKVGVVPGVIEDCIDKQYIPDGILEKIYSNIPELGALIKSSMGDVMEDAAQQRRIIELEQQNARLEKTVDNLLKIIETKNN